MFLFYAIGCLATFVIFIKIFEWLWENFSSRRSLAETYGPNTWVVITGASDGIGKGFSHVLPKYDFNVCLIGRNPSKLEDVRKSILAKNTKKEVRCVIADFRDSLTPGFYDKIYEQIKDLDISILINNVGVADLNVYHQTPEDVLENLLAVNIFPQQILTRKLINKLLERNKNNIKYKSAIINISSMAGVKPVPFDTIYSATKAMSDYHSRCLSIEYKNKIDVLSLRPFWVSTPMAFNKAPGFDTILPEECAEGCLKDLGKKSYTWGHYKHEVQGILYNCIPDWVILHAMKIIGPLMIKDREMKIKKWNDGKMRAE